MKRFQILNLLGTIVWVTGFVLCVNGLYPICYLGVYLGPALILFGVVDWIRYYIKKNGRFPRPTNSLKTEPGQNDIFALIGYFFNHILEFWVFSMIVWIIVLFIMTASMKGTAQYDVAIDYIDKDTTIQSKVGKFKDTGFLIEGTISQDDTTRLSLQVIGDTSIVDVEVKIAKTNDSYEVVSLDIFDD